MRSFQKNTRFKRMIRSKAFLAFLGAVVIFFGYSLFSLISKMEETSKNKKLAQEKLNQLENEKWKLSSEIGSLKTDKGVEENIREKFGLAKDGESMIMIVDDKNKPLAPENSSSGFFSFIKNWFK